MPIKKYLTIAAASLLASTLLWSFAAHADFLGQDALFTGIRQPTKGSDGLPSVYKSQSETFQVSLDEGDSRVPASVKPKPQTQAQHWSASASEGFEFKIRVKQQISSVWVLKRAEHYDLIFANNAGSRVNLGLPAEQFYALKNAAAELRGPASDTSSCKDSFVQLEMVEKNSHQIVSTCLNAKSKAAEQLRLFGATLTAYVR